MILTSFDAHLKCRAGAGVQTCRYLLRAVSGTPAYRCGFIDEQLRERIDGRFLRGYTTAKAGPCANPHDGNTEAAAPAFISRN